MLDKDRGISEIQIDRVLRLQRQAVVELPPRRLDIRLGEVERALSEVRVSQRRTGF